MDKSDNMKFIDEDPTEQYNYIWKKKKAIQKEKNECKEIKDFRQICIDNCRESDFNSEGSSLESKTYFGKEGSSSGDDIPDLIEEDEFQEDMCLSPRAPLVIDLEEDEYSKETFSINKEEEEACELVFDEIKHSEQEYNDEEIERECEVDGEENPHLGLEVIVSESDHERIALTSNLTVKERDGDCMKQGELKAETITDHRQPEETSGGDRLRRRRVHFEDELAEKGKCDKKEHVLPLTDEGLTIDVVFTEDVTVRVSFKEGRVVVEENERSEAGGNDADEDSIKREDVGLSDNDANNTIQGDKNQSEPALSEGGNAKSQNQYNALFTCNTDSRASDASLLKAEDVSIKQLKEEVLEITGSNLKQNEENCNILNTNLTSDLQNKNKYSKNEYKQFHHNSEEDSKFVQCNYSVAINDDINTNLGEQEKTPVEIISTETSILPERDDIIKADKVMKSDTTLNEISLDLGNNIVNKGESDTNCKKITFKNSDLDYYQDDNEYRSSMFTLHDIIEEDTQSDQSDDEDSSDSGGFFEAVEDLDLNGKCISNDEALKNHSKFEISEDSSNSESSLEKCETEPSEKEIKQKRNPILDLLEMHKKEEIYESSLETLQEFRHGLIPGITLASNWISSCDSSDELSLGVVGSDGEGEGEEGACGRWTEVSTGNGGSGGGAGRDQLSSEPSAPSDTDSDSLQGASLDTVIQVIPAVPAPPASEVIDVSSDSDEVTSDNSKSTLVNLFPIKRSTNALEDLPLIFPHARKLVVTKPVNKFENLFKPNDDKCLNNSSNCDSINITEDSVEESKKDNSERIKTINAERREDIKTERLFQFNVTQEEEVTSFCENVGNNNMKQKKKQDDNRSQDEAMGASSELCNGYHRGALKSALKRSSTKKTKKKNRVQFDESLNKFFDADYVILIREEPDDFEGDYDVGGCDCGEDFCYDDCCDEDEEEEGFQEPQSPRFDICAAFEPPVEFVDQVTLSPPDGYKDTGHYCPHHHPRLPPPPHRHSRPDGREEWQNEASSENMQVADTRTEATNTEDDLNQDTSEPSQAQDQSGLQQHQLQKQQNTQQQQRYIVETITMTTVTERRIVREADDQRVSEDNKPSGILKGGKLWKSTDIGNQTDLDEYRLNQDTDVAEDDDKKGVRFNEGGTKNDVTSGDNDKNHDRTEGSISFRVGNVISSSKPNSAVRQLFPSQRFMSPPSAIMKSPDVEDSDQNKYAMTAENLKAFEEAKKTKLHEYYSSRSNSKDDSSQTASSPQWEHPPSDDDEGLSSSLIKRTIERNTLRRSLLKYPHDIRLKRNQNKLKNENSLVERIKQLTCDVDDDLDSKGKDGDGTRTSPPGEESQKGPGMHQNRPDKIASSGMSSTYKKFTDLFSRRDKLEAVHPSVILQTPVSVERQYAYYQPVYHQQTTPPDLGNGLNTPSGFNSKHAVQRNSVTTEARKQFLSSLAPLTACVSGNLDDSPGSRDNVPTPGDRTSLASTSTAQDSEYSLDDIEEALNSEENKSQPQPDVVAGTPAGNGDQDELALFVQQDAGRIERIRKRYGSTPNSAGSDDDEHDDYGFNRRPSVRGIKPRFGSTTEILQQMQSQLQPPPLACPSRTGSHITWPYYTPDDPRRANQTRPAAVLPIMKEETHFSYLPDPNLDYNTNSPIDPTRTYQHQMIYSSSGNLHQPLRIGGGGDLQYPTRVHHLHSDSPPRVPPMGMIMPFQEHDFSYRSTAPIYARRAIPGSVVQMRVSPIPTGSAVRLPLHPPYVEPEPHYSTQPLPAGTTSIIRVGQQQTIRVPYPANGPVQVHLLATRRSESPQRGSPTQQPPNQYVVARGTQTSSISSTYYNVPPRGPFYPSRGPLVYSDSNPHNNNYPPNPHRAPSPIQSLTSSPTRMKPQNERGVPEGAASTSPAFPQDSVYQMQVSSATNIPSPGSEAPLTCDTATSPQTPIYYSMNV